MRRFRKYEPGEDDLPEGWDPEQDQDSRWDSLVELMKQADDPAMPPQSTFEAMRIESRRQALEEGLLDLPERPRSELHFRDWLRLLVSGGGLGAQCLRLGFVGSCAFLLGLQFINSSPPQEVAGATSEAMEEETVSSEQATSSEPDFSERIVVSNSARSVPRSVHDLPERPAIGNIPTNDAWSYNESVQRAVSGATPVSAHAKTIRRSDSLATQALEQVQVLKFNFVVNQDNENLAEVRKLEKTLQLLMEQVQEQNVPDGEAVRLYRRAEQYMNARRDLEAQETLERIIRISPGSPYAFIAEFQIGAIAFERTHDYRRALDSFRSCLRDYPAHIVPAQHRRYLEDRVRVLEETAEENWESVKVWQSVDEARSTKEAADRLMSVIADSASPLLISEAAIQLKELVIGDTLRGELNHKEAINRMLTRVKSLGASPESARIQFAIAEITARRLQNPSQALEEYRRVFALQPDEQTCSVTESRINNLEYLFAVSPY